MQTMIMIWGCILVAFLTFAILCLSMPEDQK